MLTEDGPLLAAVGTSDDAYNLPSWRSSVISRTTCYFVTCYATLDMAPEAKISHKCQECLRVATP